MKEELLALWEAADPALRDALLRMMGAIQEADDGDKERVRRFMAWALTQEWEITRAALGVLLLALDGDQTAWAEVEQKGGKAA